MKQLTYGMVGGAPGSFIGAQHRRAINLDNLAILTAGCFSRTPSKNITTAKELRISPEKCYRNFEEMARAESSREDGIDFVVIVTPNVSHYPIAKAFLNAGIHVACDKPLALTAEQGSELEKLAEEKELLFMVTYTYMGHVTAKHISRLIQSGKIGKIRTVMSEYPQDGMARLFNEKQKPEGWRLDPMQGGSTYCLSDLGTHVENAVSTMTHLKIKRVLAKADTMIPESILDDNDFVLVEFEGGATGMFWISKIALGHANSFCIRIFGEKGSIEWNQEECELFTLTDEKGNVHKMRRGNRGGEAEASSYARLPAGHTEGFLEAMSNLYASFTACIRAKQDGTFFPEMVDYPTVTDGLNGLRFVEACERSSKEGNIWVNITSVSS